MVSPLSQLDNCMMVIGGRPLVGTIRISGSKNAALPILAASILTDQPVSLTNFPLLSDTEVLSQILRTMGASIRIEENQAWISCQNLTYQKVSPYQASKLRASILLLSSMLARFGQAHVPKPGGDAIGERRYHLHLQGLTQMGADIREEGGEIRAMAQQLHGARITLELPTVTGTENLMMAAVLAKGTTLIEGAAREPHVVDLARFLRAMGAKIQGEGTSFVEIQGVSSLHGVNHPIIPDYLEAGTYAMAVAATGGKALLQNAPVNDLSVVLDTLRTVGVTLKTTDEGLWVEREESTKLRAMGIITEPHPGFPTDLQPPYTALMTQAVGISTITELLFEDRTHHALELSKMGAKIKVNHKQIVVEGPTPLSGECVNAENIRSGAALLIAGLCAKTPTYILGLEHLDRGYENLVGKLRGLGANVARA